MKRLIHYCILASCFFAVPVFAQIEPTANDSAKHVADVSKANGISEKEVWDAVRKDRGDSTEVIGRLQMKAMSMLRKSIYTTIDGTTRTKETVVNSGRQPVLIKRIFINVQEGEILEVVVTVIDSLAPEDKNREMIFRNKHAIMDFVHMDVRASDRLQFVTQDYRRDRDQIFLFLSDVLKYTPFASFHSVPYSDFTCVLEFDSAAPQKRYYDIKESTSLNTYFNIGAYTDIRGLSGEPNALIQFNASAKFITRTRNLSNSAVVPFHYLAFNGSFAKFDNDFKGTQLYHEDSLSRRDLLQRTLYTVGTKLNLLRGFASPTPKHMFSDWQINMGANFAGAKVYDTFYRDAAQTVIDTAYRNVATVQLYVEPIATISRYRNFSMTLTAPVFLNFLTANAKIQNGRGELWAVPGLSLMYFGKRESGSKLYFRYNYFFNMKDREHAFSQIQLGYSITLTDALNSGK